MKRILTPAIALAALSIIPVHADTLADWTFETSLPTTAGPFSPEIGSGSALGSHAGAAAYSNPAGPGSSHSFSSTIWAPGDYTQFTVNTTGFQNIQISFDQTSSNTGPADFQLQYSTGAGFTAFANYTVPANAGANAWSATGSIIAASHFTDDLSLITALNNVSTVSFRLVDLNTVSANGGTVASSGTDRIDNFTVTADLAAVPEPGTVTLAALGGFGCLFAFRRRR